MHWSPAVRDKPMTLPGCAKKMQFQLIFRKRNRSPVGKHPSSDSSIEHNPRDRFLCLEASGGGHKMLRRNSGGGGSIRQLR